MNRDSGADQPTQRTVAELLAEYGASGQKGSRRRRRRAEDPSETAPQAIIERVMSDSGQMRAIQPDAEPPQYRSHRAAGRRPAAPPPPPAAAAPPAPPAPEPPAPPAPEPPAPEPPAAEAPAEQPGGPSYWAQRFATAGGKQPAPVEGDAEATIQQPALRADAPPVPPTAPKTPPEGVTEQLPRVAPPAAPVPEEGTEVLAVPAAPPERVEEAPERDDEDPYDFDSYEEPEAEYAEDDDYDPELPAGMGADDYREDEAEDEPEPPSPAKEWGTLALQGVAGLVGGGAVWFGFRWLWGFHALAALGAALLFTGLLVFVAWKFLRNNDLQTILLSVLVGLFCTVSPAALLLISH
ncbi:hypothetical protein ABT324_17735 [Saccharopolyspora sp. NPDC000359]|uniref:hypothetical protein n=1 Tax=Saccharopolyspora sp. NPDC000359 TaxID=3154251 RepID=UPI00332DC985